MVRTVPFSARGGPASGGHGNNMLYLYVLKSKPAKRHYIGITENLEKLAKHNSGSVKSTKAYKPWQLIYCEKFTDKKSARQKENYLKRNFKAREELFDKIDLASSSNG